MPNQENKVRFNLKNVHYAPLTFTVGQGGTVTHAWGTPVHVPGAVSLDLAAESELTPFYADGVVYYRSASNNGYSGSLEMARFTDQMLQDIWGFVLGNTSMVLTENAFVDPQSFALLYQIDGDADNEYYVLYNVSGTRPNIGSNTTEDTKEPVTQTSDIAAIPMMDNGNVFARTTANTPAATKAAWFTSVFEEA